MHKPFDYNYNAQESFVHLVEIIRILYSSFVLFILTAHLSLSLNFQINSNLIAVQIKLIEFRYGDTAMDFGFICVWVCFFTVLFRFRVVDRAVCDAVSVIC